MRILFFNEIENATVTSLNGSLNYPAESIYHVFLRKRFKAVVDNDMLTITLPAAVDMNCFFMAYHNISSGTVSFYDGSLAFIDSIALSAPGDPFVSYFDTIAVRRITVDIQSDDAAVYVGGIFAGLYTQMPEVLAGFPFAVNDATSFDQSPGGQVLRNQAPALRQRELTFDNLGLYEKIDLDNKILDLGIAKPVMIDLFEGNEDYDGILYGYLGKAREIENPGNRYTVKIQLNEAR
jgi:hypothetical protein